MKIKIEGGIYKSTGKYASRYTFFGGTPRSWDEYILICPHTIEIECEDIDTRQEEVKILKGKLSELNIAHHVATTQINGRIAELLCIENTVES